MSDRAMDLLVSLLLIEAAGMLVLLFVIGGLVARSWRDWNRLRDLETRQDPRRYN